MKRKLELHINSGVCKCGHSWEDHHLSAIVNADAWSAIEKYMATHHPGRKYPPYVPEECEHFGVNECGGLMPDEAGQWVNHCHGYVDKDGPLGVVEWGTEE